MQEGKKVFPFYGPGGTSKRFVNEYSLDFNIPPGIIQNNAGVLPVHAK